MFDNSYVTYVFFTQLLCFTGTSLFPRLAGNLVPSWEGWPAAGWGSGHSHLRQNGGWPPCCGRSLCACFSSFLSTHIHIYIHTRYNYYVMSYYIILYYVILCYVSLCYVILYHIMLCYITLYYIILHYITLYYMIYIHIYLRIYLRRYFIGEDWRRRKWRGKTQIRKKWRRRRRRW